jgi:ACS family glucarate transporter-like MFS transporter
LSDKPERMAPALKFPYRHRVRALIFFLILITYLDRITISLVGVRIKSAFHLSNTQFGWVVGAFALAYAIFEIPSALLGDRIGQRKVFLRIVVWWSVFTALTGAVNGLTSLILVRFLFGIGESGAYPNCSGVVARWFPKSETTRGISWMSMGSNAGAAIAPLLVVPLAIYYGWRMPFFVNGVIGLIWVMVCYRWFRNHPAEMKKISPEEKEYIEQNRCFVSHKANFPWKRALKNYMLWALVISFFCTQWANYFFIAWMPNWLQEGKHFTEQQMKLATSYVFIIGILSSFICGIFSDRLVRKKGLRVARRAIAISCFILMAGLILISAGTNDPLIVTVALISAHFFQAPAIITCFSTCVNMGGDRAATVAGIMNFFGQMGAFLMSVIFGKIVDLTHSFNAPMFVMVGVLLIGAICWLLIDASKQITVEPAVEKHLIP